MEDVIIEAQNITKIFPGVTALKNVSIKVKRNEIHALCGENGAGKSTLVNVLSGFHTFGNYQGKIILNGKEKKFRSIKDSENSGISVIHQELSLFPELNVTENIFIDRQIKNNRLLNWYAMYSETNKWLKKLKMIDVKPKTKVKSLGIGKQQLLEICKALIKNAKILIMDEPTSALSDSEIELLFDILRNLKEEGMTCIYISHKIDELLKIADSISVLRDGQHIKTEKKDNLDKNKIIKMMVGREIKQMYPKRKPPDNEVILKIENFNVYNRDKKIISDVNFELKKGEILSITGLMGSGRTELVSSIFGSFQGKFEGNIYFNNKKIDIKSPKDALDSGFAFITEDRRNQGIIPSLNVGENITISKLIKYNKKMLIDNKAELIDMENAIKKLNIKTPSIMTEITKLSGGNQQKVLVARNLLVDPKIFIVDEPTRGIDVQAKHEIYILLNDLTKEGISIIMVSSELNEVAGMSDRVIVINKGKIAAILNNSKKDILQEQIMKHAIGEN